MKKQLWILIAFLTMATPAFADRGPIYEPGPVQKVSASSLELLNVLSANARDFAELSTFGNKVVEATVQGLSPEYTRYTVTIQQCQLRGCLGGAMLQIDQQRDLRPGLYPPYVYRTRIVRLR